MTVCSISEFLENDLVCLENHMARRRSARDLMHALIDTENRYNASLVIQASIRGHLARRKHNEQDHAARIVQKALRTRAADKPTEVSYFSYFW